MPRIYDAGNHTIVKKDFSDTLSSVFPHLPGVLVCLQNSCYEDNEIEENGEGGTDGSGWYISGEDWELRVSVHIATKMIYSRDNDRRHEPTTSSRK